MERLGRTEIKYKCCPIEEGEFALSKKMVQKRGDGKVSSQRKIIGCSFNIGVLNTVVIEGTHYYYYYIHLFPHLLLAVCVWQKSRAFIYKAKDAEEDKLIMRLVLLLISACILLGFVHSENQVLEELQRRTNQGVKSSTFSATFSTKTPKMMKAMQAKSTPQTDTTVMILRAMIPRTTIPRMTWSYILKCNTPKLTILS